MIKIVLFAALLAFAAAKPLVVEYPITVESYSAPISVEYTAPVYYSDYSTYATAYDYAPHYAHDYAPYVHEYSYDYYVHK